MKKIIAVCPYNANVLKTMIKSKTLFLIDFIIVGIRRKIIEICYLNNLNYKLFNIINVENEIDCCFVVNKMLESHEYQGILFDEISEQSKNNIVIYDCIFDILCFNEINYLLFIANSYNNNEMFETRKHLIIEGIELMSNLGISQYSVGYVVGDYQEEDKMELEVMRYIQDNVEMNLIKANDIFNNIANLLIFKSIDSALIFLDLLKLIQNKKHQHARIIKNIKTYIFDCKQIDDLYYSLYLFDKICFNS